MSLQAQPSPQQPVQMVYPTNQPPSHHSNGSFGAVFIVLAIILVISVVACFLGRLCNRRYNNNHGHSQRPPKQYSPQIHNNPREGDIEFGVDKRIPVPPPIIRTKRHGREAGIGAGPPQPHVIDNNMKDFEMRPGHVEGELRAGA